MTQIKDQIYDTQGNLISETVITLDNISDIYNYSSNIGWDELKKKVEVKAIWDALAGATDQEKFDNLANDTERDLIGHYRVVPDAVMVGFYMGQGMTLQQAQGHHLVRGTESIDRVSLACADRYNNRPAWMQIILTHYSEVVANTIVSAVRNYKDDYMGIGRVGTQYGDPEVGLLDFINDTGGVVVSLSDYTVQTGGDYNTCKAQLTAYFYG